MSPYTIMFNEEQRKLIVRLIATALTDDNLIRQLANEPVADVYPDNQLESAQGLRDMFNELENQNDEPNLLHGFCL